MKKSLLFLLFATSATTNAQIIFERPFGDAHRSILTDIAEKPQGGYVVCGSDCNTFPCLGYFASLDAMGNLLWQNYYLTPDSNFSIDDVIALDSNTYVLQCAADKPAGNFPIPRLLKTDSMGLVSDTFFVDISGICHHDYNAGLLNGANQTLWCITGIDGCGPQNFKTIVKHNGNLDSLKNLLVGDVWGTHRYCSNHLGEPAEIDRAEFYDTTTGHFTYADMLRRMDTTGTVTFDSLYSSLPPSDDFLLRDDGGFNTFRRKYPMCDTLFINHFDSNGILQFGKRYSVKSDGIKFPVLAADSGYFLILTEYDTVQFSLVNVRLCKFNNQDDTLWTLYVMRNHLDAINRVSPTSDGGCILLFNTNGFGDTLNYLMKIGKNGESILLVGEIYENALMIYPNPAAGMFTIKNLPSKAFLEVINVFGEIVYSEKLYGKNEYFIDTDFAKGMYLVRVSNEEMNVVRKLVVE